MTAKKTTTRKKPVPKKPAENVETTKAEDPKRGTRKGWKHGHSVRH